MATWMKIGTRGSPLALAQAHQTRSALAAHHGVAEDGIEIVIIRTTGDTIQDRALSQAGGKGLFTKELDSAQLEGAIDIAVHSSKDLPTYLPDGLEIAGYLPREDVRDAFISAIASRVEDLPDGAVVGTASLRRAAMVRRLRPDIRTTLLRGNVGTRLQKAKSGEVDATLLALAGLRRLGLEGEATSILEPDQFLPAVGQGAIGITARTGDDATMEKLAGILDTQTGKALAVERAFLTEVDGSCRTPIGGLARIGTGSVSFRGVILRTDGSEMYEVAGQTTAQDLDDLAWLGAELGRELRDKAPADLFG